MGTWHSAYVLQFERALLAVEPTLSGVPYWDYSRHDIPVFSETYFGLDPAQPPHIVATGRFSLWPIHKLNLSDYIHNFRNQSQWGWELPSTGYLRSHNNTIPTAHYTQYGLGELFDHPKTGVNSSTLDACVHQPTWTKL